MDLKSKEVLLVGWGCENKQDTHMYQIHYLIFKKIFPKLSTFDSKKNYFQFGKEIMNKKLLNYLKTKNFDLIIFAMDEEEFYPETFLKIAELHPNTRTLFAISDDDTRFEHYSRYYALLFDHTITSQDFVLEYKKDGINNVYYYSDYNTYRLKHLNIKKKYDIAFIGRPKANRYEIIKYLMDNKIKIRLFGWDWYKYPEFEEIYKGPINQKDYSKIINQTKINLSLTRSGYSEEKNIFNIKGSIFEIGLCQSFQLIEYNPTICKFFKPNKEIILFKTKKELIKKINYYLKHEKEREKIAERCYKKIIKKYNREKQLIEIFTKIFNKKKKKIKIPSIKKKIKLIKKEDLNLGFNKLRQELKDIDYVYFSHGKYKNSLYKNDFQLYSLEKTGKKISCCDYYVYSRGLGNYLRLRTNFAFKRIGKEANKLININQLMMKKEFFLENIESIKKFFDNREFYLLSHENTAFISIPLTGIKNLKVIDYKKMTKSFDMEFINTLFSLTYQNKILKTTYPYKLFFKSLFGQTFILKYIIKSIFNKHNWDKLALNKSYTTKSIFEKFIRKS